MGDNLQKTEGNAAFDLSAAEELAKLCMSTPLSRTVGEVEDAGQMLADACRKIEAMRAEIADLSGLLTDIGDFAHERSAGPAVPDDLWEVRRMAYDL